MSDQKSAWGRGKIMRWCVMGLVVGMACLGSRADEDEMARRAEFRRKLEQSPRETIVSGLGSGESVIRNRCVYESYVRQGRQALPSLVKLAGDGSTLVAATLLDCGSDAKARYNSVELLKALAERSPVQDVRRKAKRLFSFNFHRETMRLKDDPTNDHEVILVRRLPLPEDGWRFRADPWGDAHEKGWFEEDFKDDKWRRLRLTAWEGQGYQGYDGIGWYRLRFKMPEKPDHRAVELHFQGVDEVAWVWLNGIYVGQHDEGPAGWKTPFWIDVTRDIRWNSENLLTVRVEDSAQDGGIWRPVSVEILK